MWHGAGHSALDLSSLELAAGSFPRMDWLRWLINTIADSAD
jgi:hypothetical protein